MSDKYLAGPEYSSETVVVHHQINGNQIINN